MNRQSINSSPQISKAAFDTALIERYCNETQESSKREAYKLRRKEALKLLNPNGYPEKNKTHATYWSIEAVDFVKF